jgi:hypothetical protein
MLHISNASLWLAALLMVLTYNPAFAGQSLIPSPYPEVQGGQAQIGERPHVGSPHQELIPTPVPQTYGPDAAANPSPIRASHHQHLLKHPYWRQYHQFH